MTAGAQRVLAALVIVALVLAGGGFAWLLVRDARSPSLSGPADRPPVSVTPSPTLPVDGIAAGLRRFYQQRLAWSECEGYARAQCATMQVPLDYARPGGRAISIALLRVPAEDQAHKVGSLVVNPGGPGSPGTSYAASARRVFRDALTDRYDVVGFDPRGTGASTPIDCVSDPELDDFVAGDPDPDTTAEAEEFMAAEREFMTGCQARSGELAAHISTVEAARDMDVLRAVLGERTLDFFGASYGTKLGATYAMLFPRRVGRLVLDGAVDLQLGQREMLLEQGHGFEVALRAYVANCVDLGDCFLGDSVDAGVERIQRFLRDVDQQPMDVGDRQFRIGNAFYGVILPLYSRDSWVYLSAALKDAFSGDAGSLLYFSDLYASRNAAGGYDDNSIEANYVINCLDQPLVVDPARVPSDYADFEEASPTFGRALAWAQTGCNDFTARASEPPPSGSAAGAAPILVIGTTRDPATPYSWAVALAEQLSSAVLVTRHGDGHTGYNSGNECVDLAVEDYLVDGVVPSGPVDCPAP